MAVSFHTLSLVALVMYVWYVHHDTARPEWLLRASLITVTISTFFICTLSFPVVLKVLSLLVSALGLHAIRWKNSPELPGWDSYTELFILDFIREHGWRWIPPPEWTLGVYDWPALHILGAIASEVLAVPTLVIALWSSLFLLLATVVALWAILRRQSHSHFSLAIAGTLVLVPVTYIRMGEFTRQTFALPLIATMCLLLLSPAAVNTWTRRIALFIPVAATLVLGHHLASFVGLLAVTAALAASNVQRRREFLLPPLGVAAVAAWGAYAVYIGEAPVKLFARGYSRYFGLESSAHLTSLSLARSISEYPFHELLSRTTLVASLAMLGGTFLVHQARKREATISAYGAATATCFGLTSVALVSSSGFVELDRMLIFVYLFALLVWGTMLARIHTPRIRRVLWASLLLFVTSLPLAPFSSHLDPAFEPNYAIGDYNRFISDEMIAAAGARGVQGREVVADEAMGRLLYAKAAPERLSVDHNRVLSPRAGELVVLREENFVRFVTFYEHGRIRILPEDVRHALPQVLQQTYDSGQVWVYQR